MENYFVSITGGFIGCYYTKDLFDYNFKINKKHKYIFILSYLISCCCILSAFAGFFYDVLTTNSKENFLFLKEKFYLCFIFILDLLLFIILPLFCCFYFYKLKKKEEDVYLRSNCLKSEKSFKLRDSTKIIFSLINYILLIFLFNYLYYMFNPISLEINNDSKLKFNSIIEEIIYLNFCFLMILGKFIGFTYIPYGMVLYTLNIFKLNEEFTPNYYQRDQTDIEENVSLCENNFENNLIEEPMDRSKLNFYSRLVLFIFGSLFMVIIIISWSTFIINHILELLGNHNRSFNTIFTMNNILIFLQRNFGNITQFSFFFLFLIFKLYALIESFKSRGVALLWSNFYKIDKKLSNHQKIACLWIKVYCTIVMIFDFFILTPTISENNNISSNCNLSKGLVNSDLINFKSL